MALTTSTVTPLIVQTAPNAQVPDQIMIINPDGSITYEPNLHYKQPTIIRRTYRKLAQPKYRYTLQQEGQSYRCCQWCQRWCTRRCPIFDFCDRIVACPLLCLIPFALLLLLLFAGIITLFGLHPSINAARRYYGIISTLSIDNRTTYIFGLDSLCNKYATTRNCFNITTSTSVVRLATTVIINGNEPNNPHCFQLFTLLSFCLIFVLIMRPNN